MSCLKPKILSLVENGVLAYRTASNDTFSISLDSFELSFEPVAEVEFPNIEQYTYYYKKVDSPDTIMCIRIAGNNLRSTLGSYSLFEKRLAAI
ncbi:hypothetical protein CLV24_1405 [Pontibacter ummariensis]|uniref:Uncharacterized protein n=1 Tax=Pontibacter ummariensis TaxID=1610492 RepID=A0A239LFD9_9BACT|nr:hypothetical protein CLV24_1405 [Pontibacter ummariensis]SNT28638.1 hypothetical protein SAMN06296052_1405 [Pontibacter ummariensis]